MEDIFVWSTIVLAIWAAIGPLVGIRYGQDLARQWQKQQWVADNRKEECRELLTLLAAHFYSENVAHSDRATSDDQKRCREATFELIGAINSRVFIAPEIAKLDLQKKWFAGPGNIHIDMDDRRKSYDDLFAAIRDIALR